MITLQHSLVTYLYMDKNLFEKEISAALFPDAIRAYIGSRKGCHFEKIEKEYYENNVHDSEDDTDKISYYEYPIEVKTLTKEKALSMPMKIESINIKSPFGEETIIGKFDEMNKRLLYENPKYFFGIKKHLLEDKIFDMFREDVLPESKNSTHRDIYIDTSKNNIEITPDDARRRITEIEEFGLYILAYLVNKQDNSTITNQEWFDKHVKTALDRDYPSDLAESTYKYMKIPDKFNEWISNKDWSHIDEGPLSFDRYKKLYDECGKYLVAYPSKHLNSPTECSFEDNNQANDLLNNFFKYCHLEDYQINEYPQNKRKL